MPQTYTQAMDWPFVPWPFLGQSIKRWSGDGGKEQSLLSMHEAPGNSLHALRCLCTAFALPDLRIAPCRPARARLLCPSNSTTTTSRTTQTYTLDPRLPHPMGRLRSLYSRQPACHSDSQNIHLQSSSLRQVRQKPTCLRNQLPPRRFPRLHRLNLILSSL